MSGKVIIGFSVLLLGSWFLVGKRSFTEKLTLLIIVIAIYVGFRLISGATMEEILTPLLSK